MTEPPCYPLSAIVGQDALVDALLVNAVAPEVGGVLVRGERGTAKSTAVRAIAPLLPPVQAARGQAFAFAPGELGPAGRVPRDVPASPRPAPLVELPLGTTLDRLVGALDLSRALAGEAAFEAGLLARAHRGILYVDEVNLLPDHLVDALLDAAASGVARVEREAVSVVHAARFLLVGTMNIEEGELRPQLLDRFGLGVEVRGPRDPATRAEIVRRRLAFEHDPAAFCARWRGDEEALGRRIAAARECLPAVELPARELARIAGACAKLDVEGVRGDIVCARAARALAALDGVPEAGEDHVRRAAALALAHRRRRDPLAEHSSGDEQLDRALGEEPDDEPPPRGGGGDGTGRAAPGGGDGTGRAATTGGDAAAPSTHAGTEPDRGPSTHAGTEPDRAPGTQPGGPGPPSPAIPAGERRDPPVDARVGLGALTLPGSGGGPVGRRAKAAGPGAGEIDSRPAPPGSRDLALVPSLRARLLGDGPGALREHVRAGREGALVCLVVDASGSMGARRRLARVKGALLELLRDAYARRDRVALIAFGDDAARLVVAPGAPLEHAAAAVRELPTGGRTPLAAGLGAAERLLRREAHREPGRRAIAVVLTDGRVEDPAGEVPRAAARLAHAAGAVHVVDTEDGPVRLGLATALAAAASGTLHRLAHPPSQARRAA